MTKKQQPAGVGMKPSKTELGSFIRSRRLELDLRQVPLYKSAGLSHSAVSLLEIGDRKYLSSEQLERLAKELQCDPEELRKRMPVKPPAVQPTAELRKLIRSRREELGLTIEIFAEKMNMTPKQAKRFELSKSPNISYGLARLLADVLGLDNSIITKFVGTTRKQTKNKLGQLVRLRRKEMDMSIGQFAKKLKVSRQFVNQIEFGQCGLSQSDDMINRIANVLELEVGRLEAVRPARRLKHRNDTSTDSLGIFLATKRTELRLTQLEVSERLGTHVGAICNIELGKRRPNLDLLDKWAKVLQCEIPADLIPVPRSSQLSTTKYVYKKQSVVQLSDQSLSDIEKIKELSDLKKNNESVQKALKLLRLLLEKRNEGHSVFLRKGEDVVGMEFFV